MFQKAMVNAPSERGVNSAAKPNDAGRNRAPPSAGLLFKRIRITISSSFLLSLVFAMV
jgi:hypothetical protein